VPFVAPPNPPQAQPLYFVPLMMSVLLFFIYGLLSLFQGFKIASPAVSAQQEANHE